MQTDYTPLIPLIEAAQAGHANICSDSRKVQPGDIFVALPGSRANGFDFIEDAMNAGAKWIVCAKNAEMEGLAAGTQCEIIHVDDPRLALAHLAKGRWQAWGRTPKVIGITGTNGKTTCAWLLEYLLAGLGYKTGLLGTVEYHWPGFREQASLTTPDSLALHEMLAKMGERDVDYAIMEVSSHALAQHRVGAIDFAGAIFTNLSQDHLDFHKDMETYFRAKARLFLDLPLKNKALSINADDAYGRRLLELSPNALAYSLVVPYKDGLKGEILSISPSGMLLHMEWQGRKWEIKTHLVGAFNASNLLAIQALALKLGVDPEAFGMLEDFPGVPGRLERITNTQGLNVFVDYAHTPDALVNALQALRGAGFKRIVTLFGCGGNRDRTKRPLMGKAVSQLSDVAFLTSDNPREEDPLLIMEDVKPGLADAKEAFFEVDRKEATRKALQMISGDDALLIAGKGHEDYQILGTRKYHYSDQEVVREFLSCI